MRDNIKQIAEDLDYIVLKNSEDCNAVDEREIQEIAAESFRLGRGYDINNSRAKVIVYWDIIILSKSGFFFERDYRFGDLEKKAQEYVDNDESPEEFKGVDLNILRKRIKESKGIRKIGAEAFLKGVKFGIDNRVAYTDQYYTWINEGCDVNELDSFLLRYESEGSKKALLNLEDLRNEKMIEIQEKERLEELESKKGDNKLYSAMGSSVIGLATSVISLNEANYETSTKFLMGAGATVLMTGLGYLGAQWYNKRYVK